MQCAVQIYLIGKWHYFNIIIMCTCTLTALTHFKCWMFWKKMLNHIVFFFKRKTFFMSNVLLILCVTFVPFFNANAQILNTDTKIRCIILNLSKYIKFIVYLVFFQHTVKQNIIYFVYRTYIQYIMYENYLMLSWISL